MLITNNLFITHDYNEQHFIFGENLRDNSKIWINGEKRLTSNTGTSKKKGNIESMLSKFENWKWTRNGPETDPPWGGVG